jgi:hypothetical protein
MRSSMAKKDNKENIYDFPNNTSTRKRFGNIKFKCDGKCIYRYNIN